MKHNMVGWFEIPVNDMERAKAFYEAVFQVEIKVYTILEVCSWGGSLIGGKYLVPKAH
ncbi:VOC family protein [Snuella sedimenti]|uniref:VOC family protein n=1 Tax=Snuella sedimenti TaxID=2798802 RepID=UPI00293D206C|nr:VOC family protein [Snuella sedimenti]